MDEFQKRMAAHREDEELRAADCLRDRRRWQGRGWQGWRTEAKPQKTIAVEEGEVGPHAKALLAADKQDIQTTGLSISQQAQSAHAFKPEGFDLFANNARRLIRKTRGPDMFASSPSWPQRPAALTDHACRHVPIMADTSKAPRARAAHRGKCDAVAAPDSARPVRGQNDLLLSGIITPLPTGTDSKSSKRLAATPARAQRSVLERMGDARSAAPMCIPQARSANGVRCRSVRRLIRKTKGFDLFAGSSLWPANLKDPACSLAPALTLSNNDQDLFASCF